MSNFDLIPIENKMKSKGYFTLFDFPSLSRRRLDRLIHNGSVLVIERSHITFYSYIKPVQKVIFEFLDD